MVKDQVLKIKLHNFQYKEAVQKSEADLRMVKIFSAKLGQKSKGFDSFLHRICEQIEECCPEGMRFRDMRSYEREAQKCQIMYEGGMGWGEKLWPLKSISG